MSYDPTKPVTVSNCPTREALERGPQTQGFRKEGIGAKHTEKKKAQHQANVVARAMAQANRGRTIQKAAAK